MQPLSEFFGRLHPMVLHAPIGLIIALLAVEGASIIQRRPVAPAIRSLLAWLAAIAAALTAGAGLVLSLEPAYAATDLDLHQWLGIGVAAGALLAAILQQFKWNSAFRVLLILTCAAVIPAGHFGNTVTRGPGFLTEPFTHAGANAARRPALPASAQGTPPADSTFTMVIAPIFEARCAGCHGRAGRKSGLSLLTSEAITKGGRHGPVLVAGDPDGSEMVRRIRLPIDDDDHMPPVSDSPRAGGQPTSEEIRAIQEWVAAGASFTSSVPLPTPIKEDHPTASAPSPDGPAEPVPASPAAIAAMTERLIHVEPLRQGSSLLVVDFLAVAQQMNEAEIIQLLTPVREQIAELSLAHSRAGDQALALAAAMPNLVRLNTTATPITDAGIAALAHHPRLRELVLTQCNLTDAAAAPLASMPALKNVYLWKSGISAPAAGALHERGVLVDTGEGRTSQPVTVEGDLTLTGDAPPAGQAPPAPAQTLKPVNEICPVSGKPVDPNYAVVYKGRIIGFCCPLCAAEFWANPAKFEAKVP